MSSITKLPQWHPLTWIILIKKATWNLVMCYSSLWNSSIIKLRSISLKQRSTSLMACWTKHWTKNFYWKLDSSNYSTLQVQLLHQCTHDIASYNSHTSFLFNALTHQIHLHTQDTLLLKVWLISDTFLIGYVILFKYTMTSSSGF